MRRFEMGIETVIDDERPHVLVLRDTYSGSSVIEGPYRSGAEAWTAASIYAGSDPDGGRTEVLVRVLMPPLRLDGGVESTS